MPRTSKRTRYPGIYEVVGGKTRRYVVSYRLRGVGQRTKTYPTLADARDFQASLRDPVKAQRQRQLLRMSRETLAEYFPRWLERKRNLRESTRARYEDVGRLYILPGLGSLPLPAITREDVEEWVSRMTARGVSAFTIDKSYRTLRACLNDALEEHGLPNPARRVALPELDAGERQFLTAEQLDLVAQGVGSRYRALVYFLGYTGVRIGEASALRLRNLDLIRGQVTISENSPEVRGRRLVAGKTKTSRFRTIRFPKALATELAAHLDAYGFRVADGSLDPEALVFSAARGTPVRQGNFRSREFQPACIKAGVGRVAEGLVRPPRVHDLRHTAAALAARAGYSIHEVKEMLGHSTIKTTSDLYMHLFPDDQEAKAERLGSMMLNARDSMGTVIELPRPSGSSGGSS